MVRPIRSLITVAALLALCIEAPPPVRAAQTVIVSRPIELTPTRVGSEVVIKLTTSKKIYCAEIHRAGTAHDWVLSLSELPASQLGVGFARWHDDGTEPLPCPWKVENTVIGRVLFSLPSLGAGRLLSARLRLREVDQVNEIRSRSHCVTALFQVAINQGEWSPGVQTVARHAPLTGDGSTINLTSGVSEHDIDVTHWVADWMSGKTFNHGFALLGRQSAVTYSPAACAATFRSMKLILRIQR